MPKLTIGIWVVNLTSLLVGALIATAFVLMATSMDPSQIVVGGVEPWTNALDAGLAFLFLLALSVAALWFWHTRRLKWIGGLLTLASATGVAWACVQVYAEYF